MSSPQTTNNARTRRSPIARHLSAWLICFAGAAAATAQTRPDVHWMIGGHISDITGVAFSLDGSLSVSTSTDGTTKLWRTTDGQLLRTLTPAQGSLFAQHAPTLSPDGETVATAGGASLHLWRLVDGVLLQSFSGGLIAECTAYSPDGGYVALGGSDYSDEAAIVFRVSDGAVVNTLVADGPLLVYDMAFTPNGQTLITGSGSFATGQGTGTIRYWRLADGVETQTLTDHTGRVAALALAPDGLTFASGSEDTTIKLWNVADASLIRTFTGHTGEVTDVVFSPDGLNLASSSADGSIRIWDVATGGLVRTLTEDDGAITALDWSANGEDIVTGGGGSLASTGGGDAVRLWRATDGTLVRTFTEFASMMDAVAVSPDSSIVATADAWGRISLWSGTDGSLIGELDAETWVSSMDFSPDGQKLVAEGPDYSVKVWNVDDRELLWTLTGHDYFVCTVAFSPDGTLIATSAYDEPIRLYDASDGSFLRDIPGPACGFVFSPDSQYLAASGGTFAELYRVSDGAFIRDFVGHEYGVRALDFSPDGQLLATGSSDRTIKIWQTADATLVRTLTDHTDWIETLAFCANGEILASGTDYYDRSLRLWQVSDGTPLEVYNDDLGGGVRQLAFHPSNRFISYTRRDGVLVTVRNPYGPLPGDHDVDGDVDIADYETFAECQSAPDVQPAPLAPTTVQQCLETFGFDADGDVDLKDFAELQTAFSGEAP